MRVNQVIYSSNFQSFVNTTCFFGYIAFFILTILLPLPYHQEPAGVISVQGFVKGVSSVEQFQREAPPIIALCVLIPFLMGVICLLLYKITYIKSKNEVKKEISENVKYDYISNELKNDWEMDMEQHINNRKHRESKLELERQKSFLEITKKNRDMEAQIKKLMEEMKGAKENE